MKQLWGRLCAWLLLRRLEADVARWDRLFRRAQENLNDAEAAHEEIMAAAERAHRRLEDAKFAMTALYPPRHILKGGR